MTTHTTDTRPRAADEMTDQQAVTILAALLAAAQREPAEHTYVSSLARMLGHFCPTHRKGKSSHRGLC